MPLRLCCGSQRPPSVTHGAATEIVQRCPAEGFESRVGPPLAKEAYHDYIASAAPREIELERGCRGSRATAEPAWPRGGAKRWRISTLRGRRSQSRPLLERAADP